MEHVVLQIVKMLIVLLGDTRCSRDCLLLPAGLSLCCPGPPERLPSPRGIKLCEAKRSHYVILYLFFSVASQFCGSGMI